MIEFVRVRRISARSLIALYQEAGWWVESPQARANLSALVRGSFCFLVAKDGNALIGMGRVISDGVSDGYIHDVFVTASYRQRGIGREIVERLVVYCIQEGLEWVGLVAEAGKETFYRQLSFQPLPNSQGMVWKRE